MPLSLLIANGKTIEISDDSLLVFIDETGNERLNDPVHPVFGLGGCATTVLEYQRLIRKPWMYMKNQFFTGAKNPLHATDLVKTPPTKKQLEALNHFFSKFEFSRFATIISDKSTLHNSQDLLKIMYESLWQRIANIGKWIKFNNITIIFEDSERLEAGRSYFSQKHIKGKPKPIFCTMGKNPSEPGLEVADFVIHTAGSQVKKNFRLDKKQFEPDFEKVFRSVNPQDSDFFYIKKSEILPK